LSPQIYWLLAVALALGACRDHAAPAIAISLGPTPNDEATLVPLSSFAEYIEVSPNETHLLLTLSSNERTCDGGPEPSKDAVGLAVRLVLPEGEKLAAGSFPLLAPPKEDAGTATGSYASSTVKLRGRRRELLPGGSIELGAIDLTPRGSVEGLLKLEFPGDAEHPRTRVSGRFIAYFCRINRLR
jgi:hypothetical protein